MAEARNVSFQLDEEDFALLERETALYGGKLSRHLVARGILLRYLHDASRSELVDVVRAELQELKTTALRVDENVGELLSAAADILDRLPDRAT